MARVLVVDDDDDIRALLTFLLSADGHCVQSATDGRDALDRFEPGAFDLLCIDLDMPRMNGVDFTRAIRNGHDDDVPILMLTGSATAADLDDAHTAGIDAMLGKPFRLDALRSHVEALLEGPLPA